MPPNVQLNWIKRFYSAKLKQQFGDKVKDCKDARGLQLIEVAGFHDRKIELRFLWNFNFFICLFS